MNDFDVCEFRRNYPLSVIKEILAEFYEYLLTAKERELSLLLEPYIAESGKAMFDDSLYFAVSKNKSIVLFNDSNIFINEMYVIFYSLFQKRKLTEIEKKTNVLMKCFKQYQKTL